MKNLSRRTFISTGSSLLIGSKAYAEEGVNDVGMPTVYVQNPPLVRQDCPQWCWAASISMIFASHKRAVSQRQLVMQTFGTDPYNPASCAPLSSINIARDLTRQWTDESTGQVFQSRLTAAYDQFSNVVAINNAMIINELKNDRPLLICNRGHAMVLVGVDYRVHPWGPEIMRGGVMDPHPSRLGFHYLPYPEIVAGHVGGQMTFLGMVNTA
jgi:hypothetical protein